MTAVEWLEKELKKIPFVNPKEVFEQAKEMEKQQIIDAYQSGDGDAYNLDATKQWGEEYYNETYGSKGSETTSSQTTSDKWKEYQDWLNEVPELSDEEIEKELFDLLYDFEYEEIPNSALYKFDYDGCAKALTKWYREQLKVINDKTNG